MTKEVFVVQEGSYWQVIESNVQHSVVQVCAQIGAFNWREPYRVTEQFENRGSGFFIDDKGYFITNAHVVEDAKHIWIHVPTLGRTPFEAHVVGICPDRDLALLCLSEESVAIVGKLLGHIPFLSFGNSDMVKRTESILVMGYPLGQYTLKSTTGVVSGREQDRGYSLIQITAPVNPGSSGGPMINFKGEVVGVTIAMVPEAHNIGYVISINELRIVLSDLYSNRLVRKPFFGVRFVNTSDEKSQLYKTPKPSGLYVAKVFQGSLFDKLGVHVGDMLYVFNGFMIDEYGETHVEWSSDKVPLFDIVSRMQIGDRIDMVIYRKGERKDITGTLELHNPFVIRKKFPDYETIAYEVIGGMVIMELADNHFLELLPDAPALARFGIAENKLQSVLVITNILPGSYVHQIRTLRVGDIITHVNDEKVTDIDEFRAQIYKSVKRGIVTFTNEYGIMAALSLEKILAQEKYLSKAFAYPFSVAIKKLLRRMEKNTNEV